jgi:hypothetical protein
MAVALSKGGSPVATIPELPNEIKRTLSGLARSMARSQRYVRGIFCGGTFCFGAQLVHAHSGIKAYSNSPTGGNLPLANNWKSQEHTFVDMGADEFCQGRPHPMIDPSLRDARIREEVDDPATAVVLFDVVLGYGSAEHPTAGLLGAIGSTKAKAKAAGRTVAFISYVCGTDADPQNRNKIVADLKAAGVLVASSNAEAAAWSAALILERQAVKL